MRIVKFGLILALLCLAGCALLDRVFLTTTAEDGTITPPLIEYVTGPVGAIPGYGGIALAGIGLLTGLYKSIRARREEGKKLSVYTGVELVRENWDQINTVADMLTQLRNGVKDKATLDVINKELDDLRRKGVI